MSRPAAAGRERARGLEIGVLGPLEVSIDGRPLVVDTRKALAILALLAVENRAFGRDELSAMLWPESDDQSARGALRRTLSVLRGALGNRFLVVDRDRVSLDRRRLRLDLSVLDAAPDAHGLVGLQAAAGLARGPFLAGFSLRDSPDFDDWLATRAAAVERVTGRVLDRLADVAESGGEPAMAADAAERRVALDPLDEAAQRRLMGVLARAGDRTGAIRQYRACVSVLDRELGVPPLAETTALYEAIRDAAANAELEPRAVVSSSPTPGSGPPRARFPLVGRDTELASLLDAHRSAIPDGRLILVTGEAGSGKTRLIEAALEVVRAQGGSTLLARAHASERDVPYGLIIGLLRAGFVADDAVERLRSLPAGTLGELERVVMLPAGISTARSAGAIGTAASEPAARARLLDAIATAIAILAEGRTPGLVVVEDVQWTDDASLEAITWLLRRLSNRACLVVCTWRPEDLGPRAAWAATLEAFPWTTTISVGRFGLEAISELVRLRGGEDAAVPDAQQLFEETEGLPLYVVERIESPLDPNGQGAARGVRALLRERLESVSDTAGQVLSAAAVIGRTFDVAQLRDTSGRTEEEIVVALEELVRRGIVREQPPGSVRGLDFVHGRLRDAAYGATSLARRRLLHRRAAASLRAEPSGRDPSRFVRIAEHEREAGNDAEAALAFREAGLRARALYASTEAAAHLEAALALGHPDLLGIHRALGDIRTAQGDYPRAIAALEVAAALSSEADLPAVEVELGRVHARRGDLSTAVSHLDPAIEAVEQQPPPIDTSLLVRALVERAAVAQRAGDLDGAAAAAGRALDLAHAEGDDGGSGAALRVLGLVARDRGDLDAARGFLRRSLVLADSDPEAGSAIAARNALALVESAAGDHGVAIALLEDAAEACRRIGERHLEGVVENNLADELHAAGREVEAMEHLKHAVKALAEIGGREQLEPEIWKLVAW
jgi:DNA-binding SARP family transcriptional activator/tetratricopeptide (TPR) repeat protein/energy-coupling factor transporter ATP-binding protein EcfA2